MLMVGTALHGAPLETGYKDSIRSAQLRQHLPPELQLRIEEARKELQARRDTLSHLSAAERSQWLDSLRQEAKTRRSKALETLTPEERQRVDARLRELERQVQQHPHKSAPSGAAH